MTALLVYRTADPKVTTWAADVQARAKAKAEARWAWMAELYDAHDVPEQTRGAYLADNCRFSGLSWPGDIPVPAGWRRDAHSPDELVKPCLSTKVGKAADKAMADLASPDMRSELAGFGMPAIAFVGLAMHRAGIRCEDDGVWVTWGDKAIAEQVTVRGGEHGDNGWVRVPLVEYIERFGEDSL